MVKKAFVAGGATFDDEGGRTPAVRRVQPKPRRGGGIAVIPRASEQVNLVLGVPGVDRNDPRRFALGVLNSALGGGMSSRLFQEVREKRGLAYSVYSYHSQYSDAGLFGVYAGCLPNKVDDVLDLCRAELQRVCHRGVTLEELDRGKGQLRGSLVLGMEDTSSRMNRIGKSELVYGEMLSLDEILSRVESVTLDDVQNVASDLLEAAPTLAVIGPFEADRDFSGAVAS
jgi:predicted Zn-dependent peptidase